jgi:hypothetical protein
VSYSVSTSQLSQSVLSLTTTTMPYREESHSPPRRHLERSLSPERSNDASSSAGPSKRGRMGPNDLQRFRVSPPLQRHFVQANPIAREITPKPYERSAITHWVCGQGIETTPRDGQECSSLCGSRWVRRVSRL